MRVSCPRCGRELNVSQGVPGLEVRCPVCHEKLLWEGPGAGVESGSPMHAASAAETPASPPVHARQVPDAVHAADRAGGQLGWRLAGAGAILAVLTLLAAAAGRLSQQVFESARMKSDPVIESAGSKPGPVIIEDETTGKFPGNRIWPNLLSYVTPVELALGAQEPDFDRIRELQKQWDDQERVKQVLKEREAEIAFYEEERQKAIAEEERRKAEQRLAEALRKKEVHRQERLALAKGRRDELAGRKESLRREIYALETALGEDHAALNRLKLDAMYTQARAREWYRQQFFDVVRQVDTLTMWNAPTFLWTPQVLELRYNAEWRRYAYLDSQFAERYTLACGRLVRLNQKRQELAALEQEEKQLDQEIESLVPDPRPIPGAEPAADPDKALRDPPAGATAAESNRALAARRGRQLLELLRLAPGLVSVRCDGPRVSEM